MEIICECGHLLEEHEDTWDGGYCHGGGDSGCGCTKNIGHIVALCKLKIAIEGLTWFSGYFTGDIKGIADDTLDKIKALDEPPTSPD